jgi:hypothetical protein
MKKSFFFNTKIAKNVIISCLLLAAKFYCEVEDIYDNKNVARVLKNEIRCFPKLQKLNEMEATMVDLIDWNLFVSLSEFN